MPENADVIERLCEEFSSQLPEVVITEVVSQCRDHLSGVPTTAMPEMLERLARQRLGFLDSMPAWLP
ncbi:MAG: hypothetical protein QOH56_3194 [Pseudonocardiales bacterium]|jgi:hypothetical protein|nr:hypothetical protein [Frankiales bacterium]MDQ1736943.1 hypothetical protein [Pseudonocardiales bacterium]